METRHLNLLWRTFDSSLFKMTRDLRHELWQICDFRPPHIILSAQLLWQSETLLIRTKASGNCFWLAASVIDPLPVWSAADHCDRLHTVLKLLLLHPERSQRVEFTAADIKHTHTHTHTLHLDVLCEVWFIKVKQQHDRKHQNNKKNTPATENMFLMLSSWRWHSDVGVSLKASPIRV